MIKIKLQLQKLTDVELVEYTKLVGLKLTTNANFSTPPVVAATLTTDATSLDSLLQSRMSLESQVQQLTLQIRTAREKCESDLNLDAAYVEQIINTPVPPAVIVDPVVAASKAQSAGMDVASAATPVGPMPKVEGLKTTQGDSNGEIDLAWNPIKRGLNNYLVEATDDVTGQTGWHNIATPTKSSATATGLTSGHRYWFRVAANGTAGPGPWSEPNTKVAP